MPSDLFRQFNSGNKLSNQVPQNNIRNIFQNPLEFVRQFNQFRSMFRGNPEQMVQQMLQSGQMSQSDYAQLGQIASEFQKLLPKF